LKVAAFNHNAAFFTMAVFVKIVVKILKPILTWNKLF
jgi:hypothetical protein